MQVLHSNKYHVACICYGLFRQPVCAHQGTERSSDVANPSQHNGSWVKVIGKANISYHESYLRTNVRRERGQVAGHLLARSNWLQQRQRKGKSSRTVGAADIICACLSQRSCAAADVQTRSFGPQQCENWQARASDSDQEELISRGV